MTKKSKPTKITKKPSTLLQAKLQTSKPTAPRQVQSRDNILFSLKKKSEKQR